MFVHASDNVASCAESHSNGIHYPEPNQHSYKRSIERRTSYEIHKREIKWGIHENYILISFSLLIEHNRNTLVSPLYIYVYIFFLCAHFQCEHKYTYSNTFKRSEVPLGCGLTEQIVVDYMHIHFHRSAHIHLN